MSRFARRHLTWAMVALLGCAAGGPISAQPGPPRTYVWSETLSVPEGKEILAPSAVASASERELLVADGLERPRLLLFGKQGVSWQLQTEVTLPSVASSLTFDGERWVASLRGEGGLMAFDRTDLSARKIPVQPELVVGRVASTPGGNLLAFDLASRRVVELSPSGEVVRETAVPGHVTGLTADWSGGFLVTLADEAKVLRFNREWEQAEAWELPPIDGKPAWPVGLTAEEGGRTTVLDRHGGRLLEFDSTGRWVASGSRRGWEPGLLFLPSSFDH
ncbi:MAG: hypothetical protein WBP10_07915, partial [Thermoanaerobaculia bacterium]